LATVGLRTLVIEPTLLITQHPPHLQSPRRLRGDTTAAGVAATATTSCRAVGSQCPTLVVRGGSLSSRFRLSGRGVQAQPRQQWSTQHGAASPLSARGCAARGRRALFLPFPHTASDAAPSARYSKAPFTAGGRRGAAASRRPRRQAVPMTTARALPSLGVRGGRGHAGAGRSAGACANGSTLLARVSGAAAAAAARNAP